MKRNVLNDALSIRNDVSCRYDTSYGYDCTFPFNGDVEGWNVYSDIYLYGSWNKVLFGTSKTVSCYIGRTSNIPPVVAENFYTFSVMLKITAPENPYKSFPTKAKLQWTTNSDNTWDENKSTIIDLVETDNWHLYTINMAELQYWAGYITNLRFAPFIDGYADIQFAIKYIRIESDKHFTCSNTQCSYYPEYAHPCPAIGSFSSAEAGVAKSHYTTVSGISDSLIVDIDAYGPERINLGTHTNLPGPAMAKVIMDKLSRLDIGSYAYSVVDHTEDNKLSITSGNLGESAGEQFLYSTRELTIYVVAYSINESFLSVIEANSCTYSNPASYLHVISGTKLSILSMFYNNVQTSNLPTIAESLEAQGYFIDIQEIRASDTVHVAQSYQYDAHYYYGFECDTTITYDEMTSICIAMSMNDFQGASYSGNWFRDNTNGVELLRDPAINMFNSTPYFNQLDTKSITLYLRYAASNLMVWSFGEQNAPNLVVNGCESRASKIEVLEKYTDGWANSRWPGLFANSTGGIKIIGGTAAQELGFLDDAGNSTYSVTQGEGPATGFDFKAARRLRAFEINKLVDNDSDELAYYHNPDQPVVEAGRRDFYESITANDTSKSDSPDFYKTISGENSIIIDYTHPINDCGRLNEIKFNGKRYEDLIPSVIVFRPNKAGQLRTLAEVSLYKELDTSVYTVENGTHIVNMNVFVAKGDIIGFKNVGLLCPHSSITRLPNATIHRIPATTDLNKQVDPGIVYSQGIIGPSYYACSFRVQDSVNLIADLGKRLNLDKLRISGKEYGDYFEYNLAACLDVMWECDLYNDTHRHSAVNENNGITYYWTHKNIAYGIESLNDCKRTIDGGRQGTSYGKDSNGLATYGPHSYFYVNGDAEWLYGEGGKYEFNYPYGSVTTFDYEYDPIALYIIVPENKSVSLHKSIIHFKESNNFKKMGISYYMGPNSVGGDAPGRGYSYVKGIRSVALDGVRYYPDEMSETDKAVTTSDYVIPNPMPSPKINYVDDKPTNGLIYQVAGNTEWNVFEHDFDPVRAYGFKIFCDWHKSTKIVEIELYSKFKVVPSLADNFTARSSVYGDYWDFISFREDVTDPHLIHADFKSSPRYLKIDISPQSKFELREISVTTNEAALKTLKCDNTVLLDSAKSKEMSSVSKVDLENTYDVPLNLFVNIPKSETATGKLLSWIKMEDAETSKYAELGPGVRVEKNADYPLVLANNQVAINTPSYYLENLINNKKAYVYQKNNNWSEFGVLKADEVIDYSNDPSDFSAEVGFDAVSSRYWKVFFGDGTDHSIYALDVFYEGSEQKPKYIWMQSEFGTTAVNKVPVTLDEHGIFTKTEILKDDFNDRKFLDKWAPNIDHGVHLVEDLGSIAPVTISGTSEATLSTTLNYKLNSFDTEVMFTFYPRDVYIQQQITFNFFDSKGIKLMYVQIFSNFGTSYFRTYTYNPDYVYDVLASETQTEYILSSNVSVAKYILARTEGKLRLLVKKEGRHLRYIRVYAQSDNALIYEYAPSRTIFSSRINAFSFNFKGLDDGFLLPQDIPDRQQFDVKTFIIDISDNYSDTENYAGIRQIDFYSKDGTRYGITAGSNCDVFSNGHYNGYSVAAYAFNTNTSTTGAQGDYYNQNGWLSSNVSTPKRLVCNFYDMKRISRIVINNYHSNGGYTHRGSKDVKIYITEKDYIDTTYGDVPEGAQLIYDGVLRKHVASNVTDNEVVLVDAPNPYLDEIMNDKQYMSVESISINALPYLNNYDSLVFGYSNPLPVDQLKITMNNKDVDHAVIYTSNDHDKDFNVWARNGTRFRMSNSSDSAVYSSGWIKRLQYTYRYYGDAEPYRALDHDYWYQYRGYVAVWQNLGPLPQWLVYDFGDGNECAVNFIYISFKTYTYAYPGIPVPGKFQIFGSNDDSQDWENKPKDLLHEYERDLTSTGHIGVLDTHRPYRYYCVYYPDVDGSGNDYVMGIDRMYLYSDVANHGYFSYARQGGVEKEYSSDVTSSIIGRFQYVDTYTTWYSNSYNYYPIAFRFDDIQPISGYKLVPVHSSAMSDLIAYGYWQYSLDTTDGIDGTWTTFDDFKKLKYPQRYYWYTPTVYFDQPIYARWIRIMYSGGYAYNRDFTEFHFIMGTVSSQLSITTKNYDNYFAIDLDDVYSLDFIRNYGDATNKLNLFNQDIKISETPTDKPDDVVWGDYVINTKVDARWLRIPLLCGDDTTRIIRKLGVYPDTSQAYRKHGGYNCTWLPLGTTLTDYRYSFNAAPSGTFVQADYTTLSSVKTYIIDIAGAWASTTYTSIRSIEFVDADDNIYYLSQLPRETNFTAYANKYYNNTSYTPQHTFNSNTSKTGGWANNAWITPHNNATNSRLICVFHEPIQISKLIINNGHSSGNSTYSAKYVAMYVSSEEITDVTYAKVYESMLPIYKGDLPRHVSLDREDSFNIEVTDVELEPTYYLDWGPLNAIQGDSSLTGFSNCWGFKPTMIASKPWFLLDLGQAYSIGHFKLTHSPDDYDTSTWRNTAYKIYGKEKLEDEYITLISITGNTAGYREHYLDTPLLLRYIKLEIVSYTKPADPERIYDYKTNTYVMFDGGFLREFEIWTSDGMSLVNSEQHPVVCTNLIEAQTLSGHELVTVKEEGTNNIDWDNDEQFFKYSDNSSDNPHHVSFLDSHGMTNVFNHDDQLFDYNTGLFSMPVEESLYLSPGYYILDWESYGVVTEGGVYVEFTGKITVKCSAQKIASGTWLVQQNTFSIDSTNEGLYYVTVRRASDDVYKWGARKLKLTRNVSNTQWVLVKRDTASNHAWSNNSSDYGIDYLNKLRVFAQGMFYATEYPWWWSSTISTVTSDPINTKVGKSSIRVDYPTSSGVDRLDFIEGDHFGWDENWSPKDTLSFHWYISDLDNLYIDEGGFGFGSFAGHDKVDYTDASGKDVTIYTDTAFYTWDFKYMDLKTGWNEVNLQFDENTYTMPLTSRSTGLMEDKLNFKESLMTSFGVVYKGKGEPFHMLFDGMQIKRNWYNDTVKGSKGLCLSWREYAELPISGLNLREGSISLWLKFYTTTAGMDHFGDVKSRTIFSITNNNNETICLSIKSSGWFEVGFGGARYNFKTMYADPYEYNLDGVTFGRGDVAHVALVWSNDGKSMGNDDTLRLYVNNKLVIATKETWSVEDSKSALLRLGGGTTILANNNDEYGSAIFSNLKLYNYCKDEFDLDTHYPRELEAVSTNSLVQVSKDGDVFHDFNSEELPLKYEEVQPGEKVSIYTRVDKTNMKNVRNTTGIIDVEWEVIV